MKILSTNDIHQSIPKWKQLVKIVEANHPDVVLIAGDLFPKTTFLDHLKFLPSMEKYVKRIREVGSKFVFTLGNDDNVNAIPFLQERQEDLWYYLDNSVCEIDGVEFAGMPYVNDYPFGYKQWVRAETQNNLNIDVNQIAIPCILGPDNNILDIDDLKDYLRALPSLEECLNNTASQLKSIKNSIWLIHQPPINTKLACIRGNIDTGSSSVLNFIIENQPLLTIHGHIHENFIVTQKWFCNINNTVAVQNGQLSYDLFFNWIELDKDGNLIHLERDVFDKDAENFYLDLDYRK